MALNSNSINLKNVTKKYKNNKGIFNIDIEIKSGEVFGFIGPNGAGKTTTIRQIMGFIKPDSGTIKINKINSWKNSKKINEKLGYIPGELILPNYMSGIKYLKTCCKIRKNVEWTYVEHLINYFELNSKIKIKKMSKGMKQKVTIIAAIMHKPEVLILDEPTNGLDPLIQEKFLRVIKKLKNEGTTIFFSSHIFSEIEELADKVAFIKNGKIVFQGKIEDLKIQKETETYSLKLINKKDINSILNIKKIKFEQDKKDKLLFKTEINKKEINIFFKKISEFELEFCTKINVGLKEDFLKFYEGANNNEL